ncbi:MAG: DUF4037 domain-containing protein [Gammaproteobacteria bacterium]|nr:DUF4037 domain-containing protein [Gammaproteobacteria bacterium]
MRKVAKFVPGLELARAFFLEAVEPLMPGALRYSAALIGPGSEVLGFDDEMSSDHHWGPRVMIFLTDDDFARRDELERLLAHALPATFMGYSTHFSPPDPADKGTRQLTDHASGPVNHRVEFYTIPRFVRGYLHAEIDAGISVNDWLAMPSQRLRALTGGAVFRDDLGLNVLRERLGWYPRDIWLHQMASVWQRIGQEEHLLGRADYRGDVLGASLIASRLIRDVMRLAFLMEKVYAPYPKWFGTAFDRLARAGSLKPLLLAAMTRREPLYEAFELMAQAHNELGLTNVMSTRCGTFFARGFNVIGGETFAAALREVISDAQVKSLPLIGGVDVYSDNTDLLERPWILKRAD